MAKLNTREYYYLDIYNNCYNRPIAVTNIDDFSFDDLLFHPNPSIRAFSLIVIVKHIEEGNTTTVQPLAAIYDNKIWNVKTMRKKNTLGTSIRTITTCDNGKESFNYEGKLRLISCNSQDEIMDKFGYFSKHPIIKKRVKNIIR